MDIEEAKKIILEHLSEICTVKSTKWVENEDGDGYVEVDAGFSEKELADMRAYHYRDMKEYYKLMDLISDLI